MELGGGRIQVFYLGLVAITLLTAASPPPSPLTVPGFGPRGHTAGSALEVFIGREKLRRFDVGLWLDGVFGPAVSLGRRLAAEIRIRGTEAFAPRHVAGFAGPVMLACPVARRLQWLGASATIRIVWPFQFGRAVAVGVFAGRGS
jgi:hypothetical protein